MKVISEKGIVSSADHVKPCLSHLENMLQELRQCEERKRQQNVESISVTTKQKLLSDHLKNTKDELAATRASKAKLCEEIGALKQAKEHQTKQLNKYKVDLQTARESHEAMTKKMKELETLTGTIKQQYIRSLALRIKSSAQALQHLNVLHGTTSNVQIAEVYSESEQRNNNKRKRTSALQEGSKPEQAGIALDVESRSGNELMKTAAETKAASEGKYDTLLSTCDVDSEKTTVGAENKYQIEELLAQITKLEAEKSASDEKYAVLDNKYNEVLAETKKSAKDIEDKNSKIEELEQMLKIARSSPSADSNSAGEDKTTIDGRLKMLADNLSQMNGYADQLEMVIAQCPSCTIKLQNESTQDSVANKIE